MTHPRGSGCSPKWQYRNSENGIWAHPKEKSWLRPCIRATVFYWQIYGHVNKQGRFKDRFHPRPFLAFPCFFFSLSTVHTQNSKTFHDHFQDFFYVFHDQKSTSCFQNNVKTIVCSRLFLASPLSEKSFSVIFHDFSWHTLTFHDFSGLERESVKFHDFHLRFMTFNFMTGWSVLR